MIAPARESGTASAAVGGALCAAATCGPLPGVNVATGLEDMLAALGAERVPLRFASAGAPGSAAAGTAGFEPVAAPSDSVPVEEEEDIGAWSGRGWATSGECAAGLSFFWGVATQKHEASCDQTVLCIRISHPMKGELAHV